MRHYVEAFYDDGRQALGMGSGQATFEARYPQRTKAWKHVLRLCIVGDSWKGCTRWHLVDERRNVVAVAVKRQPVRTIDGPVLA